MQLAEEWANEIVALGSKLPERWAAKQIRQAVNTAQLADLKVFEQNVEEIMARSGTNVTYTRISLGGKTREIDRSTDGLGFQAETHTIGTRKLYRQQGEEWQQVKAIPNRGYPSTLPFNWSIGLLNSARNGSMGSDSYLTTCLWGHNRKCLAAWRDKDADLVSFWGLLSEPSDQRPPIAMRLVFDGETHLVAQYALVYFEGGVTRKNIEKKAYKLIEEGRVNWEPMTTSTELSDAGEIQRAYVPTYVTILSTMNDGQEIECENRIQWLFGDEVPSSTFKDPRSDEFKEPTFSEE